MSNNERSSYQDDDDNSNSLSGSLGPPPTMWLRELREQRDSDHLNPDTPPPPIDKLTTDRLPQNSGPSSVAPSGPPSYPYNPHLFSDRYGANSGDAQPGPGAPSNNPPPPISPLGAFAGPGAGNDSTRNPASAEAGDSMYARRPTDDPLGPTLSQRRAEDERMTGRRWPGGASLTNPHDALYFQALGIALGEMAPSALAREAAMRYLRAARTPSEDDLGPTDIFAIFYFGLGLTLRPLDCSGLPHVLAVYNRATREVYLDWRLLQDPPYGRATFDPNAWRRAVDNSLLARFLLTWCVGVHLMDNFDLPLVLGFAPQPITTPIGAQASAAPPSPSAELLNRYRKGIIAVATLLAPQERLWQQILALRLRIHMGDPNWRAHMRMEYGYGGGLTGLGGPGFFSPPGAQADPADQLIAVLAERNNCPPSLIESQLDGATNTLDWNNWTTQLLREIPPLQMRYAAAARMFHTGAAGGATWNTAVGSNRNSNGSSIQPIHIQLAL